MDANGVDKRPMLTTAAAAKQTGIPSSMIRRALVDGALPYVQPNGDRGWRLIRPADLEAWVQAITKDKKK